MPDDLVKLQFVPKDKIEELRESGMTVALSNMLSLAAKGGGPKGTMKRTFSNSLGSGYERFVEISSVDAFQGREANIVIFSCVRAAGSKGIGFLSDVRRMNVALTRAKHFLFVIARCSSIIVNPYWRDLVDHARETEAVIQVPFSGSRQSFSFPDLWTLKAMPPMQQKPTMVAPANHRKRHKVDRNNSVNEKPSHGRGYRM